MPLASSSPTTRARNKCSGGATLGEPNFRPRAMPSLGLKTLTLVCMELFSVEGHITDSMQCKRRLMFFDVHPRTFGVPKHRQVSSAAFAYLPWRKRRQLFASLHRALRSGGPACLFGATLCTRLGQAVATREPPQAPSRVVSAFVYARREDLRRVASLQVCLRFFYNFDSTQPLLRQRPLSYGELRRSQRSL